MVNPPWASALLKNVWKTTGHWEGSSNWLEQHFSLNELIVFLGLRLGGVTYQTKEDNKPTRAKGQGEQPETRREGKENEGPRINLAGCKILSVSPG